MQLLQVLSWYPVYLPFTCFTGAKEQILKYCEAAGKRVSRHPQTQTHYWMNHSFINQWISCEHMSVCVCVLLWFSFFCVCVCRQTHVHSYVSWQVLSAIKQICMHTGASQTKVFSSMKSSIPTAPPKSYYKQLKPLINCGINKLWKGREQGGEK